jgi:hypothetical protein
LAKVAKPAKVAAPDMPATPSTIATKSAMIISTAIILAAVIIGGISITNAKRHDNAVRCAGLGGQIWSWVSDGGGADERRLLAVAGCDATWLTWPKGD